MDPDENKPPKISAIDVPELRNSLPRATKKPSSCFSYSSSAGIKGGLTDLGGLCCAAGGGVPFLKGGALGS